MPAAQRQEVNEVDKAGASRLCLLVAPMHGASSHPTICFNSSSLAFLPW